MPNHDTMQREYQRLLKVDGHLGALYDARRDVIRFVCRAGTIDYNLSDLRAKSARREERAMQDTEA